MVTDALRDYIAGERAKGVGDEALREVLLKAGWKEEDVVEAMVKLDPSDIEKEDPELAEAIRDAGMGMSKSEIAQVAAMPMSQLEKEDVSAPQTGDAGTGMQQSVASKITEQEQSAQAAQAQPSSIEQDPLELMKTEAVAQEVKPGEPSSQSGTEAHDALATIPQESTYGTTQGQPSRFRLFLSTHRPMIIGGVVTLVIAISASVGFYYIATNPSGKTLLLAAKEAALPSSFALSFSLSGMTTDSAPYSLTLQELFKEDAFNLTGEIATSDEAKPFSISITGPVNTANGMFLVDTVVSMPDNGKTETVTSKLLHDGKTLSLSFTKDGETGLSLFGRTLPFTQDEWLSYQPIREDQPTSDKGSFLAQVLPVDEISKLNKETMPAVKKALDDSLSLMPLARPEKVTEDGVALYKVRARILPEQVINLYRGLYNVFNSSTPVESKLAKVSSYVNSSFELDVYLLQSTRALYKIELREEGARGTLSKLAMSLTLKDQNATQLSLPSIASTKTLLAVDEMLRSQIIDVASEQADEQARLLSETSSSTVILDEELDTVRRDDILRIADAISKYQSANMSKLPISLALVTKELPLVPQDPATDEPYVYTVTDKGLGYTLCAKMDATSTPSCYVMTGTTTAWR